MFSTKFLEDKRLRIDIAQMQEIIENKQDALKLTKKGLRLADYLTRRGVKPDSLMEAIKQEPFQRMRRKRERLG